MKRLGLTLNKSLGDIMDTTVGGLHPSIRRFVMVNAPKTWDDALDCARRASILKDPNDGKVEVEIATLMDRVEKIENGMQSRGHNKMGYAENNQQPAKNGQIFYSPAPQYRQTNSDHYNVRQKHIKGSHGNPEKESCNSCGGSHSRRYCRFIRSKCRFCGRIGHLDTVCRQRLDKKKS